jgi:hypothetical protein
VAGLELDPPAAGDDRRHEAVDGPEVHR